jgi:hypothetical protein
VVGLVEAPLGAAKRIVKWRKRENVITCGPKQKKSRSFEEKLILQTICYIQSIGNTRRVASADTRITID